MRVDWSSCGSEAPRRSRLGAFAFLAFSLVLLLAMWSAAPARAAFGVEAFDGLVINQNGGGYAQAGGHPFAATTVFKTNTTIDPLGNVLPDGGGVKEIEVDLPQGFTGNATVATKCSPRQFVTPPEGVGQEANPATCPASSQVGTVLPTLAVGPICCITVQTNPVYQLEPPPGVAAQFGFKIGSSTIFLDAGVRPDDYGLRAKIHNVSQAITVVGGSFTLWGVPADPAHDSERYCFHSFSPGCSTDVQPKPLLTNPTSCSPPGEGLLTKLHVVSWVGPEVMADSSFESHDPPGYSNANPLPPDQWGPAQGPTGCGLQPFNPSIAVKPDATQPDAPTGLAVDLSFPQEGLVNSSGLATAHLRRARVTLPEGLTISPSGASGLEACSDAQLGIGTDDPLRCPDASKIGTAKADTPILDEPLEGGIYVGSQESDDPESGQMFRIFLVLENKERGLLVKLPGQVRANGETGRIETVFDNNPQLPVRSISLRFKTGPRAALATPTTCGRKTIDAELTSWAGQTRTLSDSFTIDCPQDLNGFAPGFKAGTANIVGGAFSPFIVQIDRPDRQQFLTGLALELPTGVLAKLKGVPLCGDVQAAAGTCPIETRVGTATVGAGPGSNPFFLKGSVSLTGPYRGGPYGLSVAVRAAAGPFDLGTVVVRQAIYVDPVDAHLTVVSDPVPTVVKGVPVRLRSINVDVDRPGFTINPTSCAVKQIGATFGSIQGAIARQTSRFQTGLCDRLEFKPKLSLQLTGRGQTTDGRHPGLNAVLTQGRGQAGIKAVKVALPLSLALDPENAASDSLCEFDEGQKANPKCPASSIIGRAKAISPVLNRPLTGNVYFVKNVRIDQRTGRRIRTLPTLLVPLRGEVALNLRARTSISRGKLVNTFPTVPDAPVSRFELSLKGGKKGILVVTNGRNVCKGKQVATVNIAAQNGRRVDPHVAMKPRCR
jgi:hypothetical protein